MARIPTYVSEQSNAGPTGVVAGTLATPQEFGADQGAQQQKGGEALVETAAGRFGLGALGLGIYEKEAKKQDKLEEANHVAKFDFSKTFLDMQTAATDPKDFQQNVANKFDETVDKYVNGLNVNEDVRTAVKEKLLGQRQGYMTGAANFETKTLDARDKLDADEGIKTQVNLVRANGDVGVYNDAKGKIDAIIDAQPGIPDVQKRAMKVASEQTLARRRFDGLIAASNDDPTALLGIKNELEHDETWKKVMHERDYDNVLDQVDKKMKSANTAEAAAGRAAMADIKKENADGVWIDDARMAGVADAVNRSNRPELMSQFAMMKARNDVFKLGKTLPPSEQRAAYEQSLKAGGVANMPEPVKAGIASGVALTNGAVSAAFLAGTAQIEYGRHLASGDYGKGTDVVGKDGKPVTDVMGVMQWSKGTFLSTVRAHADQLGVTAALSDEELLKMRADPKFAIETAALHALDNKNVLQQALRRDVNDGDLYFAHLLGTQGAVNFLSKGDANPRGLATSAVSAEEANNNRGIFFNEAGKPRTFFEARAAIAGLAMNSTSRKDYGVAQAWQTVITATQKGLKEDPMTFAQSQGGRFADIGDINTPDGIARRGVAAQQVAEFYGVPSQDFKPFTKDEVETLGKKARDGTADETLAVMKSVAGLGGNMAKAGFKQIGEKDTLFGYAAGLAYVGGDQGVAGDIIRGEKRMREDKDIKAAIGQSDADMTTTFQGIVGKSLMGTEIGTKVRQAAEAYYAEKHISRGGATVGAFNKPLFTEAVNAVLGGQGKPIVAAYNGAQMKLPQGMNVETFGTAVDRMSVADYGALSKWGAPPRYTDGSLAMPRDIANEGKFEWIGGNEYRIKMADNSYLLSGVQDNRAAAYIFIGDAKTLAQYAARPKMDDPNRKMLPAMVDGVQPAQPRVIE